MNSATGNLGPTQFMVPEDQQEGAALSAPAPIDQSTSQGEPEAAESAEGANGGDARINWADLSDGVADSTSFAAPLEQPDLDEEIPELEPEAAEVGELSGEGAAFGAPGEIAEFDLPPRFDALSLLDPVKQEEEAEVTADQIFQELEAAPAEPSSSVVEASDPREETHPAEVDNPNKPTQETVEAAASAEVDPIVGSSPSVEEASASNSTFAPVYVSYPAEQAEEEEPIPPPPTSPFLEQEGAALGASTTGHVQTGHSSSGPSRQPRIRGTKGGKKEQTKKLIQRWQSDFDQLVWFLWENAGFHLRYFHHSDADSEFIWTVRVIRALLEHCTPDQILVDFANVFRPYRDWTWKHG